MVKSGAGKKDAETFKTLLRLSKNPFQETEKELDDLSEIVSRVNRIENTEEAKADEFTSTKK